MTASLILRKLGSYPRQNSLALGLREIGRVERTLFMLACLEDPALRRRVTAGLNKGEARNSLARAVLFRIRLPMSMWGLSDTNSRVDLSAFTDMKKRNLLKKLKKSLRKY